jgi:hypothetical protein
MEIKKVKWLTCLILMILPLGCKKEGSIEIIGHVKPSGYYLYVGNWLKFAAPKTVKIIKLFASTYRLKKVCYYFPV